MNEQESMAAESTEVMAGAWPEDDGWDAEALTGADETEAEEAPEAEGESEEKASEEDEPKAEEEPAADPADGEPKHKVTFYGKEYELPTSELVALAQKGMNYDNVVKQSQQAVQEHPAIQVLGRYAEANGMSLEEYVAFIEKSEADMAVQKLVTERNMDEATARRHYELERKERQREQEEKRRQADTAATNAYLPLVQKYGDVGELSPEVQLLISQGVPPLFAYERVQEQQKMDTLQKEIETLKTSLAAKEVDKKNRSTAPGSATGLDTGAAKDQFLQGWDAV